MAKGKKHGGTHIGSFYQPGLVVAAVSPPRTPQLELTWPQLLQEKLGSVARH